MVKIGIIIGSTRPGRKAEAVARWLHELVKGRKDATFEIVDIQTFNLPLLDEPIPPSQGRYAREHTRVRADAIAKFDGYIFVTPEYNHATSGALKNAIDFLYKEWNNKAAAFVGYGSAGGVRAVENLRVIMGELQVADVRQQVALSLHTDFEAFETFKPAAHQEKSVREMCNQLISWSEAMRRMREPEVMSMEIDSGDHNQIEQRFVPTH